MKGYCVDVSEFDLQKKEMVADAIKILTGCEVEFSASSGQKRIGNVTGRGQILGKLMWGAKIPNANQSPYLISFDNLMTEAHCKYAKDGVEGFKAKSPNKTRPLITREQYDAVMAQSDKRTFTKALDDLLAIEKEQLLDESAIRINQLERENIDLVKAETSSKIATSIFRGKNDRLKAKLEKHKRISGVLSLLLISSVAAQLAVIFLQ